jgi:hypothetical protein
VLRPILDQHGTWKQRLHERAPPEAGGEAPFLVEEDALVCIRASCVDVPLAQCMEAVDGAVTLLEPGEEPPRVEEDERHRADQWQAPRASDVPDLGRSRMPECFGLGHAPISRARRHPWIPHQQLWVLQTSSPWCLPPA